MILYKMFGILKKKVHADVPLLSVLSICVTMRLGLIPSS